MPELPEVETVRDGLQRWVAGRTVAAVEVTHPRSVRRHLAGAPDLVARLTGAAFEGASRRGKYLWLPLAGRGECLVGHLGMSGQLLVRPADAPHEKHLHVRIAFTDGGPELRFVDQRTFGGVLIDRLVPAADRPDELVPAEVAHIARDPLDPHFDEALFTDDKESVAQAIRRSSRKAAALDVKPMPQTVKPKRRDWLAEQRDRLRRLDFFKRLRRAAAMPPPQPERRRLARAARRSRRPRCSTRRHSRRAPG